MPSYGKLNLPTQNKCAFLGPVTMNREKIWREWGAVCVGLPDSEFDRLFEELKERLDKYAEFLQIMEGLTGDEFWEKVTEGTDLYLDASKAWRMCLAAAIREGRKDDLREFNTLMDLRGHRYDGEPRQAIENPF